MNNLEKYVTTLEASKELKGVGFVLETPFWWYRMGYNKKKSTPKKDRKHELICKMEGLPAGYAENIDIPAYLTDQLWGVLNKVHFDDEGWFQISGYCVNRYFMLTDYDEISNGHWDKGHLPDTLASAVVWCIKEGYINENMRVSNHYTKTKPPKY